MIRNLKVLGFAAIAALALSAVVASAASAQAKLTSDGPVTLKGTQTGAAGANSLVGFGLETTCPNATYTGHEYEKTPHTTIPNGATTATITPHYGVCHTSNFPTTVDMNGCDYDFHLLALIGDVAAVRAFITCPKDQHITLTVFGSHTKHTANEPFCDITITENPAGYLGLSVTDTTNGTGDITGEITGIEAHKSSPTGSILCPTQTGNTVLKQDVTITGQNGEGGPTSISLS